MTDLFKVLILGGTRNARDLAILLQDNKNLDVTTSLAGRTQEPDRTFGKTRIGGFGGIQGLVKYLRDNKIDLLVDSTHPFATNISKNARNACDETGVRRIILDRPQWLRRPKDKWINCANLDEAARKLPANCTAFLALGHQYLDAFSTRDDVNFIVRLIDRPKQKIRLKNHRLVVDKPSHSACEEVQLFRQHAVTHLVSRNSGGTLIYAKIEAARRLQIPVLMIARPAAVEGERCETIAEIAAIIIRLAS